MVKNTKQIALIQNRRGRLSELPTQLNDGEFGLATDTNELFIGNGSNPALAERVASNTFPWGNVQILTEFTDNLKIITYRYESNTDVEARLPVIISGSVIPEVYANTSIKINGVEVLFDRRSTDITYIVKTINETEDLPVKAFNNNGKLGLISTETEITLEDTDRTYQGIGLVYYLGFGEDGFYSAVSGVPSERSLQDVLDDFVSVKSYDANGNGRDDDSENIYNAIVSLNKAGDSAEYYRTLLFPAGNYIINSKTIPLPHGAHLKGEGMGRTVLKITKTDDACMTTMDSNMLLGTDTTGLFGVNAEAPKYITVEDLTIDASEGGSNIVKLASCETVIFKNVEIIGKPESYGLSLIGNSKHIILDNCIFNGGSLVSSESVEHLIVKNCLFKNIVNEAIKLDPISGNEIVNCVFEGNIFTNDSLNTDSVIFLGNNTQFVNFRDSRFDENVAKGLVNTKPYITTSELNFTDTLDASTSDKKLLQFRFTQPLWEYVDYLMNVHGEYLLQPHYNMIWVDGEQVPAHLTNGLILEQGDETNENTVTVGSSNPLANLNVNAGGYGNLQLGKDIDATSYKDWEVSHYYNIGDRIQYYKGDGIFEIWEAIANHQADYNDIDYDEYGNQIGYDENKWTLIDTLTPKIEVGKNIDLQNHHIEDSVGNITFQTNENYLKINDIGYDETDEDSKSYAERVSSDPMAIPNVDYVSTIAQSTVRKQFTYDVITGTGTPRQEFFWFDPSIYGDYVGMNYISINVRRPFYPVVNGLSEAFDWKPGNTYYKGEIVKTIIEDSQREVINRFCQLENGAWVDKTIRKITDESEMDSPTQDPDTHKWYRKPLANTGNTGDFVVWYEPLESGKRYIYQKVDSSTWLNVESDAYAERFSSYAQGKAGRTAPKDSIFNLNDNNIALTTELSSVDVNTAVSIINEKTSLTHVVASNNGGALRLSQNVGVIKISDVSLSPLESFGFTINPSTFTFDVNTIKFALTFDGTQPTPSNYINGSIWLDTVGNNAYLVCRETHVSSQNIYEDLGNGDNTYIISKWQEVFETVRDVKDETIKPLKDLKYVSLYAINSDAEENSARLLFSKSIINVAKRDINSIYELPWTTNTSYSVGERCLSHGRYWECLKAHTSSDVDELHNSELWIAVTEQGYNYHFDFERDMYKINANGDVVPANDTVVNYNFADYHFYLVFYDDEVDLSGHDNPQELIEFITTGDNKHTIQVNPYGYIWITMNYIRGSSKDYE